MNSQTELEKFRHMLPGVKSPDRYATCAVNALDNSRSEVQNKSPIQAGSVRELLQCGGLVPSSRRTLMTIRNHIYLGVYRPMGVVILFSK